jgi:hypothetical protein
LRPSSAIKCHQKSTSNSAGSSVGPLAPPRATPRLGGVYVSCQNFPCSFVLVLALRELGLRLGVKAPLPLRASSRGVLPGAGALECGNVLGPVPGVDVMAKRSQGWVKCEDRLPYYRDSSCSLPLPRPHDHNSTTPRPARTSRRGGARGKGPARVGLLGLQCSARALFRTALFKKNVTRIASLD